LSARRPRVAFTAPPFLPDLHDDWPLVRAALDAVGVDAVAVVWSDPSADWRSFDLIVANGAWDNIHRVDEFLEWLAVRESEGVPMVNSPATLRWNLDKRYLRALEAAGVAIVPTTWVETGGPDGDAEVSLPAGEVVVKPSISGGGHRTARYQSAELGKARAHVRELVGAGRTAMVQPYQASVDELGEAGLIFLGGEYSHAIRKDPMIRRGVGPLDSLIDNQVVRAATASDVQIDLAQRAVAAAESLLGPTTYARVDIVERTDGEQALLELELLDPVLFFAVVPERTAAFADVVRQRLGVT
jgi:glutathione synthase/RimK-type ligase-like ATP-grasp enzyme